jgi:hypothetical protein
VSRASILAVAAAGALAAAPARAEPAPLRIDYEATGGCPGAAVFLEEIQWRTSLARVAGPTEAALPVKVRIVRRGPVNSGRLVLGEGRGAITREVQGARCDEVVSALALITALAVDPRARTASKPPPPPAVAAPPLAASSPAPPEGSAGEPASALPPPQIIGDPLPASPVAGDAPPAPGGPRWSFGTGAVAAFAVTPRPLLGGGVFADRAFDGGGGASLRLAVDLAGTGDFNVGPGGAWFLRGVVRVEGCAFAQRAGPWFRLVPCLGVEGGAIEGGGILRGSLVEVQRAAVPWFGAGVLPRAAFDLGAVVIEVQGGPTFPAVRRTFSFERPDYVIYTLPPVTWTIGLGVEAHFP